MTKPDLSDAFAQDLMKKLTDIRDSILEKNKKIEFLEFDIDNLEREVSSLEDELDDVSCQLDDYLAEDEEEDDCPCCNEP